MSTDQDQPESRPTPDLLPSVVAKLESAFAAVDDNYIHGPAVSKTARGARFVRVLPGVDKVTDPIGYDDHATCAADWLAAASGLAAPGKVLVWRVPPHFVTHPVKGFYIDSIFAVEDGVDLAYLADENDTRRKQVRAMAAPAETAEAAIAKT